LKAAYQSIDKFASDKFMNTSAWPHSSIKEIFPDIFFVSGMNKINYNGITLQHSRNMIIARNADHLSLINTVRLSDEGLQALDALGKVENIIRIGAFHGRDDAFYIDRYDAKLWALQGMKHENNRVTDIDLTPNGLMPFQNCTLFVFDTSVHPEGILHIDQDGGILVACDSIKNWLGGDQFFSSETEKLYEAQGFFGPASISPIWKQACAVKASDFIRLQSFSFNHLLSAHGDPLLDKANIELKKTIKKIFRIQ
jgi:hypothetical protein